MTKSLIKLTAGMILLLPALAGANGWYGSLQGSAVVLQDADSRSIDLTDGDVDIFDIEYDAGFGFSGAGGYGWDTGERFCNTLRAEGELTYRGNDHDRITELGFSLPLPGEISAFSAMGNVSCDMPVGPAGTKIFLIGGLGVANIDVDFGFIDDDDTVFAYQFGIGASHPVTDMIDVLVQYRYFGTTDPEVDRGVDRVELEYSSHNIQVGVRMDFPGL